MKKHLAIFSSDAIKQLFAGKKTIESRFSQKRIAPYGMVSIGDLVYIKPPGQEIVGQFLVKKAIFFEGIDQADWQLIKVHFSPKMSFGSKIADEEYFNKRRDARYGTVIFLDQVEQFITAPVKVAKKDLRGWMVLN